MEGSCNIYIVLQLWEAKLENMEVGEKQSSTVTEIGQYRMKNMRVSFQREE